MAHRHVSVGTFHCSPQMKALVNEVLDSGRISYGEKSREFEHRFAELHGCEYAILSNSGTSALQIALQAMKEVHEWDDGDQVIVPATTFVATSNIVIHNRMEPVFVDVDEKTYNMDPDLIPQKITDKTRAIIPVHLFGYPADMDRINTIADQNQLEVIVDSCETMFVAKEEQLGDIGCFSTYVAHLIVTGVGGISTTNNAKYAAKMRSLVNHGLAINQLNPGDNFSPQPTPGRRFWFETMGHSYRITEMEAALGLAQIEDHYIEDMLKERVKHARHYNAGIRLINQDYGRVLQSPYDVENSANMMYPIVMLSGTKEQLIYWLNSRGVETRDMMPILTQPSYRYLDKKKFPVSHNIIKRGFYVGCHQDLDSEDVQFVLDSIREYFSLEVGRTLEKDG